MTRSMTSSLGELTVGRLGFGAMQLCGPGVMGPPRDRAKSVAVLRRAVELGVNHIDTAQYYGPGVANELIHQALHPYPEDLALVSKVGVTRNPKGAWLPAQTPAELRSGVEDNLRTLGTERLAAVNLRISDHPAANQPDFVDQLAEMVALRDEGKIAGVGVSNVTTDQVRVAIAEADIVCVQNPYSLVDRHDEDVLQLCDDYGIAYVPFFPLGSAFRRQPKVVDQPAAQAVARRLGVTAAQVGLAWLLTHAVNVLLIPGTSSVAHLEENLAVADIELSAEDIAELEA